MLDLKEIKRLHDKAYVTGQVTRERAADDMVFYYVTHWDDNALQESPLEYRGQFDLLKKAGRDIMSNLAASEVQVDFFPKDESRDDAAELLDGKYRADCNLNSSKEAFNNALTESIVCGFGAYVLETEYETKTSGETNQVIRRRPLFEANNCVYCDPNAKLLDRSDADYWSVLTPYSADGYKKLVKELTGEELDEINPQSFKTPEQSYAYPWILGEGEKIYVCDFYHREEVLVKLLTMENPFGQTIIVRESELEDVMDEMLDDGFEIVAEKEVYQYEITKYTCSGADILETVVIPGQHIPIVPQYGEHAWVEGEPHYEGVTRLAKDPQRLRNFQLSYLADLAAQSPRRKPVVTQEQIAGHEWMYEQNGADNNYPYYLVNSVTEDGRAVVPAFGEMPEQPIPTALAASIELSRQAIQDVASSSAVQNIMDVDLSGKAVRELQARIDMQAVVYQEHRKHAHRRDGEIYASMAAVVYDVPRTVAIQLPDGRRQTVKMIEQVMDSETGEFVTVNDLRNVEFEVYSKIGTSYSSQKEQTLERIADLLGNLNPADEKYNILLLQYLQLMDGVAFDDLREYANQQLMLAGIRKPETPEEEQMLEQRQQAAQQPSADMILAHGELLKGQAAQMREQRENIKMQLDARTKEGALAVDMFEAQTDRMNTQVNAQKAGASIRKDDVETVSKIIEMRRPDQLSNDELWRVALGR